MNAKKNQNNDPIFHFGFQKENYKWLLIGLAINILGYILMIGGGSDNPTIFKEEELFSSTRLNVAPVLIIAGFIVMIFAIMKKPKSTEKTEE